MTRSLVKPFFPAERLLCFALLGMVAFCCGQELHADTYGYWRLQEATSGFAGPSGEPPEMAVDDGDFFDPNGIWDLDMKTSSPMYDNSALPVAPGGTAVAGNTAYMSFAAGSTHGLFRSVGFPDPGGGFVADDDGFTWEVFYRRSGVDTSGNFYGNAQAGGCANTCPGISRIGVDADGDIVTRYVGAGVGGAAGGVASEFTIPAPDDADWHHFAFTVTPDPNPTEPTDPTHPGILRTYVDYIQVGGDMKLESPPDLLLDYENHVFSGTGFLTLGFSNDTSAGSPGNYWDGDLDELRISTDALHPSLFLGSTVTPPLPEDADFNGDGDVDGVDYLAWQGGFGAIGTGTLATGDANDDMNVDAADLAIWETQYATALLGGAAAVPEPSALLLTLLASGSLLARRQSR